MSVNSSQLLRPTQLVHQFLAHLPLEGANVIDATLGNGHDALSLAQRVGKMGVVTGFDVQPNALEISLERLAAQGMADVARFFAMSHAKMADMVAAASQRLVLFNLGYLPGGDHAVFTLSEETLCALDAATVVLEPDGWLVVTCYPGHHGGDTEAENVEGWFLAQASSGWQVAKYQRLGTKNPAPFLLIGIKPKARESGQSGAHERKKTHELPVRLEEEDSF